MWLPGEPRVWAVPHRGKPDVETEQERLGEVAIRPFVKKLLETGQPFFTLTGKGHEEARQPLLVPRGRTEGERQGRRGGVVPAVCISDPGGDRDRCRPESGNIT